jgi:ABC-type cobalamin/Fe3+-siderophores transport system ATPase subunit
VFSIDFKDYRPPIPQMHFDFKRINVILGANGTGKSKILHEIYNYAKSKLQRPSVRIFGGRSINFPYQLRYDSDLYRKTKTIQLAQTHYQNSESSIPERIKAILFLLDRKNEELFRKHSKEVTEWQRQGEVGPSPKCETSPFEKWFQMFSEIFPEISLSIKEGEPKEIFCKKNDIKYNPSTLSDGEKQVLFILADLILVAEPTSIVVVDEPELNLNPQLAIRVWETIEAHLSEAIFIYATHSISFAIRTSVETLIALSRKGQPSLQITDINELDSEYLREFLGAIPAVLSSKKAIAIEGRDSSFDLLFYRWLINNPDISIVPLADCHSVKAATTKTRIWEKLAPSVKILGIIDRDYRSEEELEKYQKSCLVLDYHEAESYLCHPDVIITLAQAVGAVESIPTSEDISKRILDSLALDKLKIAANRTAIRFWTNFSVSLSRQKIGQCHNEEQLKQAFTEELRAQTQKLEPLSDQILVYLDQELTAINNIIQNKNIEGALVFLPAKNLIIQLANLIGVKDSLALARTAAKHLDIEAFQHLKALKNKMQL